MPTAVEHLREASTPPNLSWLPVQIVWSKCFPNPATNPPNSSFHRATIPLPTPIPFTDSDHRRNSVGTPFKYSPFTQFRNLYFTQAIYPKTNRMNLLALLQAGDVHRNPGPLEDLLQIIEEQNHTPSFNIPHINLRSWFTNRTLQVRIGQKLSKTVLLKSGVPQGSVLAPTILHWRHPHHH